MSIQSLIAAITPITLTGGDVSGSVEPRPDPLDCEVCPWASHLVRVRGEMCVGKTSCPMRSVREGWGY